MSSISSSVPTEVISSYIVYATSVPGPDWGGSLPESEWFLSAAQILWFNQSVNAAVYLGAMAWGTMAFSQTCLQLTLVLPGLHTAIFYKAARAVWRGSHQSRVTWLPLIGTLWAMATINMACNVRFNELAFVDSSGYNGGPFAYVVAYQSSPVNVAAVSTAIVSLCLADVFLVCILLPVHNHLTSNLPSYTVSMFCGGSGTSPHHCTYYS